MTEREKYLDDLKVLPIGSELIGQYCDYTYSIKRQKMGHLCGYVILPDGVVIDQSNENNYNVHGGITYNDGKKIGFDAAHYDDWNSIITMEGSTYKDVNFMKNEIVKLIDQIEEKKLPVGINV